MSDGSSKNSRYARWANPDRTVGSSLWELSRHPKAEGWSSMAGIVWIITFLWIGLGIIPDGHPLSSIALVVVGVVGLVAAFTINEMAGDIICPGCGYRTSGSFSYCPSCSHEFDHGNPRA